jgi:hypothetical protein
MELLQVYAQDFCQLSKLLAETGVFLLNGGALEESHFKRLFWAVETAKKWADALDLPATADKCTEVQALVRSGVSPESLASALNEVSSRMQSELSRRRLLYVPSPVCGFYDKPQFSLQAEKRFGPAIDDMIEAGKCFALNRYTACVFHLQRVLEVGLKSLAVHLGLPLDRNTWDAHLKDIERELDRREKIGTGRDPDRMFYSGAAAQFRSMQIAWRNPTMHVDQRYTEEIAQQIFDAVKGFMHHLAIGLSGDISP